jgi:hypothetical protein
MAAGKHANFAFKNWKPGSARLPSSGLLKKRVGRLPVWRGAKDLDRVFAEIRAVRDGCGNGSIIGRKTFRRSKKEALDMLGKIVRIYQGKD